MSAAVLLATASLMLGLAALAEIRRASAPRKDREGAQGRAPVLTGPVADIVGRLRLRNRVTRAGLEGQLEMPVLLAAKLACAVAGTGFGALAAPAAPGRLSFLVALGLPIAGFLAPDAWLERRARIRLRGLRGSLPDALDLLATSTAAGRSPVAGLAEISSGTGPLSRELGVLVAETSSGFPQREALAGLRRRVPIREVAALSGLIERSSRYGSPLAEQLSAQASALRGDQRRRIEEEAARAAPKIQLAVALLLVPSVLLMIAAGLLANLDRFLAGL